MALGSPGRGVVRAESAQGASEAGPGRAETRLTRGLERSQGWELGQTEPEHRWVPRAS